MGIPRRGDMIGVLFVVAEMGFWFSGWERRSMMETYSGQEHVSLPRAPENQRNVRDPGKRDYQEEEKRIRHVNALSGKIRFIATLRVLPTRYKIREVGSPLHV